MEYGKTNEKQEKFSHFHATNKFYSKYNYVYFKKIYDWNRCMNDNNTGNEKNQTYYQIFLFWKAKLVNSIHKEQGWIGIRHCLPPIDKQWYFIPSPFKFHKQRIKTKHFH